MSDTPYLYVIRKRQDVIDLDKYLGLVRSVGELNFLCKPRKCYNVIPSHISDSFRYVKTDLAAAITVECSDTLKSFDWHKKPRIEQRAVGYSTKDYWNIVRAYKYDENYQISSTTVDGILPNENETWQDYSLKHLFNLELKK